jgi:UDP-N-acetylglucosamine--N-acetylmuramyl-(pentapeptide) pyrophosphoryl-undecaprenol N-acetylglucosamine transferase
MINRVIISGGGTGGHIFPAIAIANEIKRTNPSVAILFVGALGKMEMEKVPLAGYEIVGLKIVGLKRSLDFSNLLLPIKLLLSLWKARQIIKQFKPELVIGVGGYASGPTLKMASWLSIPTVIQEQNSFPGKTNLLLAKKASLICTAYDNLDTFFPKEKLLLTGNPVRPESVDIVNKRQEALNFYSFDASKKTILILGGSLGARSINEAVVFALKNESQDPQIQFLWQCGNLYFDTLSLELDLPENVKMLRFIERMDFAYAAADVIVSRAGATSISELCMIGKPIILVPSPNVSEDHQTKNAMALVNQNAALLVRDIDAKEVLIARSIELLRQNELGMQLSENIKKLARPNASEDIVEACQNVLANLTVKNGK